MARRKVKRQPIKQKQKKSDVSFHVYLFSPGGSRKSEIKRISQMALGQPPSTRNPLIFNKHLSASVSVLLTALVVLYSWLLYSTPSCHHILCLVKFAVFTCYCVQLCSQWSVLLAQMISSWSVDFLAWIKINLGKCS